MGKPEENVRPSVALPTPPGGFRWVPVRSLAARHRPRIQAHLVALPDHDRYLRFGYIASDAQIGHYVDLLDFERDEVFGVFNRRLELVAMAHLAYLGNRGGQSKAAEFGVSVSGRLRGRGVGSRLFDHAILHARNRRVDTLLVHALSENTPMLRMARSAGATVVRDGGDSDAYLKIPHEDLASRIEALVEGGAAELDYSFKQQAHRIGGFLSSLGEVKAGVGQSGKTASE
jgi:ribosomal protein S18 acetylase RimI-like enzyme